MAYGAEGKALTDQVWEETLNEFKFVGAHEIVEEMRR
jgi:hypothetical protein